MTNEQHFDPTTATLQDIQRRYRVDWSNACRIKEDFAALRAPQVVAPAPVAPPDDQRIYPCKECGVLRSKAEGGTTFTVCDACWNKSVAPPAQEPETPCEEDCGEFVCSRRKGHNGLHMAGENAKRFDALPPSPAAPSPSDVEQAKEDAALEIANGVPVESALDALIAAVRIEEQERHDETVIAYEGEGIAPDSVPDGYSYSAEVVRQKIAAVRQEPAAEIERLNQELRKSNAQGWLTRQAGQP